MTDILIANWIYENLSGIIFFAITLLLLFFVSVINNFIIKSELTSIRKQVEMINNKEHYTPEKKEKE